MTALYGFGNNSLYYFSQSGAVTSVVGDPTAFVPVGHTPFDVHSACVGAAYNSVPNPPNWIAVSNRGEIAYSEDLAQPWARYFLTQLPANITPLLNIRRIIVHLGLYIIIGSQKDPQTLHEYGVIYTSALGNAANTWYLAYKCTDSHSMIMDVSAVAATTTLVAVGYKQGMKTALLLVSSDSGLNWEEQSIDTNTIKGAIYSVAIAGNPINVVPADTIKLYLGGNGWVSIVDFATNQFYLLTDQFLLNGRPKPIYRLISVNSEDSPPTGKIITSNIVALQNHKIYFTSNLFDWQTVEQPGYNFSSAAYSELFNSGTWYFGSESMLNQYNLFTLKTNPITITRIVNDVSYTTTYHQIAEDQDLLKFNCVLQIQEFVEGS